MIVGGALRFAALTVRKAGAKTPNLSIEINSPKSLALFIPIWNTTKIFYFTLAN